MRGTFCECINDQTNVVILLGFVGIALISIGTQMITVAPVTVGKIPFAFIVGSISLLFGGVNVILFLFTRKHISDKRKKMHIALAFVAIVSGIVNMVNNPREETVCTCPKNYYGSNSQGFMDECIICDCANGTCSDTVYGDGSCTCPERYDQSGGCRNCIAGARGEQCEHCKVGWKFNGVSGSCTECYEGYNKSNGKCDHTKTGIITHTCEDGWKTECVKSDLLDKKPPWVRANTNKTDCLLYPATFDRTVICDKCKEGHNGRQCEKANCIKPGSINYTSNLERFTNPPESTIPCYDDYDCDSFHCIDNRVCGVPIRERKGCICNNGYAGPTCEPCSDNVVVLGDPCVKGYCQYNFITEKPFCLCDTDFEALGKICTKRLSDGECEPGYWGEECKKCTCEHGVCNDRKTGNGKCQYCYYSESIFSGTGIWTGDICNQCLVTYDPDGFTGCGVRCTPTPNDQQCRS